MRRNIQIRTRIGYVLACFGEVGFVLWDAYLLIALPASWTAPNEVMAAWFLGLAVVGALLIATDPAISWRIWRYRVDRIGVYRRAWIFINVGLTFLAGAFLAEIRHQSGASDWIIAAAPLNLVGFICLITGVVLFIKR